MGANGREEKTSAGERMGSSGSSRSSSSRGSRRGSNISGAARPQPLIASPVSRRRCCGCRCGDAAKPTGEKLSTVSCRPAALSDVAPMAEPKCPPTLLESLTPGRVASHCHGQR